ncbi:DNA-binding response regulator [Galactobacter valiniphilus]|uniref:DNA-binding response regulator n=1 Tax=Galactobacter valiniphilus TaxID=2676122 RepID=A0A399JAR8_9MICC|nr:response regulator transcription factor [Galactobacter valiniphilus]RII41122.1 DNA-binding response regulator [Galactobacter valiniphilus]
MSRPGHRASVLLVDDDEAVRETVGAYLSRAGFAVSTAADGAQGLLAVQTQRPDVVVTDVLMPVMDGRELVRRLRERGDWVPVILLTQVGEAAERSAALDEGADDYLNKPFDPQELASRIRALARRTAATRGAPADVLVAGPRASGAVRLERIGRRVFLGEREVALTPKAFALLEYLLGYPEELHSRERLLERVWGFEIAVSTRAVDPRVAELGRVLEDDPAEPTLLKTVPGGGYRVVAEVRRG